MAIAARLATRKRLMNHSVWKTTVRKLQEQGILNSDVAAITGHRNVQSLQQYAEMEQENHAQISKVLRSGHQCAVARPPPHDCNPNIQATLSLATPIVPHQYNFRNCTVYSLTTHKQAVHLHSGVGGDGRGGVGAHWRHIVVGRNHQCARPHSRKGYH